MGTADVIAMTEKYQMANYARFPVVFVRGEGARLFDAEGREYLDFLGGIAVALLGHTHPEVTRAVTVQARNLLHVSNLFHVPVQAEAGRLLSESTIGGKVFFCNSGTEANEAAIKLTRKWFADRGKEEVHEFVVLEGASRTGWGAQFSTGEKCSVFTRRRHPAPLGALANLPGVCHGAVRRHRRLRERPDEPDLCIPRRAHPGGERCPDAPARVSQGGRAPLPAERHSPVGG